MKSKVCMVTGASSGIGKAAALGLAEKNATVALVCRNKEKGERVRGEIISKTKNSKIFVLIADLSSQKQIRKLVKKFKQQFNRLDILINCAGVFYTRRHVTEDRLEMTFAVNYLAYFFLTNLLLDILVKSAPSRVINVAGAYHANGKINFSDLQMEKNYDGNKANSQAKLADILFTYELARRMKKKGVTVNCLHPGAVATSLIEKDKDYPYLLKLIYRLFKPILKSPEKGAQIIIYLAASREVEGITGKYFINKKPTKSSRLSYDTKLAGRLWITSKKLTNVNS